MFLKYALGCAAALIAANSATAQNLPQGMHLGGYVEFERLTGSNADQSISVGKLDFGYTAPAMGSGLALGVDLGIDAFSADKNSDQQLYGAATVSGSFGKLSIGLPRFVMGDYLDTPAVAGVQYLSYSEFGIVTGRDLGTILRSFNEGFDLAGLRYDGSFDKLSFGASVHKLSNNDADGVLIGLAGAYDLGAVKIMAGVESVKGSDIKGDLNHSSLAVSYGTGPFEFGGMINSTTFIKANVDSVKLWGSYAASDRLKITLTHFALTDGQFFGEFDTMSGVSVDYSFWKGAYLQAGVLGISNSRPVMDLSVGFRY